MNCFPLDHFKSIMTYDPKTGVLVWKERTPETFGCDERERKRACSRWNSLRANKSVGGKNKFGYIKVTVLKKQYLAHRIAWAIFYGSEPNGQIDHINGIKHDNRIENLRVVTPAQNAQNKQKSVRNKSGHVGVTFRNSTNRWRAKICYHGKVFELGTFLKKEKAIAAYQAAAAKFGFHANHGKEKCNF